MCGVCGNNASRHEIDSIVETPGKIVYDVGLCVGKKRGEIDAIARVLCWARGLCHPEFLELDLESELLCLFNLDV